MDGLVIIAIAVGATVAFVAALRAYTRRHLRRGTRSADID